MRERQGFPENPEQNTPHRDRRRKYPGKTSLKFLAAFGLVTGSYFGAIEAERIADGDFGHDFKDNSGKTVVTGWPAEFIDGFGVVMTLWGFGLTAYALQAGKSAESENSGKRDKKE